MNTQLISYGIGATNFAVGLSAAILVTPPAGANGVQIKFMATGGTLWMNGTSTIGSGDTLGTSEIYKVWGPARFFLSAQGATASVGIRWTLSAGVTFSGPQVDFPS